MAQDRLGPAVWLALVSQFLMNTASFMVMPLFAVYMSRHLSFTAAQIGTVLTVHLVSTRLLPVLAGPLTDRAGYRVTSAAGMFIRALGFAGFLAFADWPTLVLCTLLIGTGSAVYEPAVKAVFAEQPQAVRPRVFAYHNLVLNLGVIVGPALGSLLTLYRPWLPFLASTIAFALIGALLAVVGAAFPAPSHKPLILQSYRHVLSHRSFRAFLVIMSLWWAVYAQLFVSFPVRATELGGGEQWAGMVFLANGATGLVTILAVMRILRRGARPSRLLVWGFAVAVAGFGAVPAVTSLWWLLTCVVVYTIAETIMLPAGEILVADYAKRGSAGTFFGVYEGSWAAGGSLGSYLGSWLILLGDEVTPWLVYAGIAALGALAMHRHDSRRHRIAGEAPRAAPSAAGDATSGASP